MARPQHLYEPGFPYLITSVTHQRQPLLSRNGNGRRVLTDLDFYRTEFRYKLIGYVIMPDTFMRSSCLQKKTFSALLMS